MWIIERYVTLISAFALFWGLLYGWTHFSCNPVRSRQMQPYLTDESFVIVRPGTAMPDDVEAQETVVQFERAVQNRNHTRFVGRVIGKPGDRIRMEKGKLQRAARGGSKLDFAAETYVAQELMNRETDELEEIVVPRDCYWLLQDNRRKEAELDSRTFGPISIHAIDGRVGKIPFSK